MITYGMQINQGSVDSLFRKLDRIAAIEVLRAPMEASLLSLQADLTDYPPPPQRPYPKMLRTPKQRKYFFWALGKGIIKVPYTRTGKLGQSWTWKITETGTGLRGTVGTNMSYAKWVQNEESQAMIHRSNWPTDARVVDRRRAEIGRRFAAAIKRATAGR